MTRQEIEKRLEELKRDKFFLAMKDRWTASDYEYDRKLFEEITELKERIKNA